MSDTPPTACSTSIAGGKVSGGEATRPRQSKAHLPWPWGSQSERAKLSFGDLFMDEQRLVLRHLDKRDLCAVAVVNYRFCINVYEERLRRGKIDDNTARERRLVRDAILRGADGNARLIGAVLRHMLINAPHMYTDPRPSRWAASVPGAVCRLRVPTESPGWGESGSVSSAALVAELDRLRHDPQGTPSVDALAMQESSLREVPLLGEPLGPIGATAALRQARALGLDPPARLALGHRGYKIFVRADTLTALLANSPTLEKLVTGDYDLNNQSAGGEGRQDEPYPVLDGDGFPVDLDPLKPVPIDPAPPIEHLAAAAGPHTPSAAPLEPSAAASAPPVGASRYVPAPAGAPASGSALAPPAAVQHQGGVRKPEPLPEWLQ